MKTALSISILLNLALATWWFLNPKPQAAVPTAAKRYEICVQGIPKGESVPAFSGTDIKGRAFDSAANKGSLVLVNFWSLSCAECLREIPSLNSLYVKYRNRGFTVVGVNTDVGDERERVAKFMQNMLVTYPMLLDAHGTIKTQLFIGQPPAGFLVDRENRLIAVREEWLKAGDDGLADLIEKHLD